MYSISDSAKVGDTFYRCDKLKGADRYHVYEIEILEVIRGMTPKGRLKKPQFRVKCKGFLYQDKEEGIFTSRDVSDFYRTPREAVFAAVYTYISKLGIHDNPEERLLKAIYNEDRPTLQKVEDLPGFFDTIANFRSLYDRAVH